MAIENKILSDITVHMKYARYLPEEQRRETVPLRFEIRGAIENLNEINLENHS